MRVWDVYAKSGLAFCSACLSTVLLARGLAAHVPDETLRLAAAFSLVQVSAVAVMAIYLVVRRWYAQFHRNVSEQLRPAVQDNVTALALTGQAWPATIPKRGVAREVLEECLATSLLGLKESGRKRLREFAWEHGFAKQWQSAFSSASVSERKRAIALWSLVSRAEDDALMRAGLADREPAIRTEAARALIAGGVADSVELVFRSVLGDSLLIRVLLTSDLKRHARALLTKTVPLVLAEPDRMRVVHCLQILTAWKLAIPGFDITPLLRQDQDRSVLPLAISLLPYVEAEDSVEESLCAALEAPDIEVQCAAARAAGQLGLRGLMPLLLHLLSQNARLASASAEALAHLGSEGARGLQAAVAGADKRAAAAALEALETSAVGIE